MLLFSWFNALAFAVCMAGPRQPWPDTMRAWIDESVARGYVVAWSNPDGDGGVFVNGQRLSESRDESLCRTMFDADGDSVVTLRDWATLVNTVAWCDGGRCIRVTG